jgi:parvulin-like peptidyl-prolyl isomerase
MLRTTKPFALVLAAAWLVPLGALMAQTNVVAPARSASPSGDAVVARGKGLEIRRSQLEKEVGAAKAQMASRGRQFKAGEAQEAERQVLEQLINVQLVLTKATAADQAAGKEAAQKRLAASVKKIGSDEAFDAQLKFMGASRQALLAKWIEALTAQAVLKRVFNITVTDQAAREFYDTNPTQFDAPQAVRASHILLVTVDPKTGAPISDEEKAAKQKKAEELLKRARAGEDFAKLAKEFSEDTASKFRGGEYTFAHGQMVPEVEAAAFAMNTNQIGDIVTSSYGYHIIKVSEKLPAHKIPFAEAVTDIKNTLTQQAVEQRFPDYVAELRKDAGVEILDEKLKPNGPEVERIPAPPSRGPQVNPSQSK